MRLSGNHCRYIAERIRPEITLCFADDNFGMYPADEEIADYLGYLQERFHWPRYIRTTTGKNKSERIIRVMRKVRGAMPMTAAVQSLNPVVLKNIERSNISLETYAEIQREVQAQGMQSYGELILSLPGETKASFMQAVRDLLEAGVKRVSASLSAQPEWVTSYDVELWSVEGYVKDLATYRFPTPQRRSTFVPPEQRALIESRIATFGESPSALGKFTRTIFARDLRRTLRVDGVNGYGGSVNGAEII